MSRERKVAIIGAGLVGSLTAILLSKRGYKVDVYESRSDMRKQNSAGGRSINLALSSRGWRALKLAGVEEETRKLVIPMKGRMMHNESGKLTFQPYGKQGQHINSISRGGLNMLLMNAATKAGAQFHFNIKCTYVNYKTSTLIFDRQGHTDTRTADLIIGTDGAYSAVRNAIQRTNRFNYEQYFIDHGYKELVIPADADGNHQLDKNSLHIWPRGQYMLIALPNLDGSFTVTLFLPFEGTDSFKSFESDEAVQKFFRNVFPDAMALMPTLLDDWHKNPTSSLVTIRCYPWIKNNTLLIGDASHAVVPFYGQGMNSGFEDVRILKELLDRHNDKWEVVMPEFQKLRKPDADAISELALQNFIEMRDLVADENFLLRKKIEARLHEKFPDKWIPQYSMVTFHDEIRYSEAQAIGKLQQEIMDEVMEMPGIENNWKDIDLEEIVGKLLIN